MFILTVSPHSIHSFLQYFIPVLKHTFSTADSGLTLRITGLCILTRQFENRDLLTSLVCVDLYCIYRPLGRC